LHSVTNNEDMFSCKLAVAKLLVDASGSLQCPQALTYTDHSEDYCEAGKGLSQRRTKQKDNMQFVKTQCSSSNVKTPHTNRSKSYAHISH